MTVRYLALESRWRGLHWSLAIGGAICQKSISAPRSRPSFPRPNRASPLPCFEVIQCAVVVVIGRAFTEPNFKLARGAVTASLAVPHETCLHD